MSELYKYAIAYGNPADGFSYVGTFDSIDEAQEYEEGKKTSDWWIVQLIKPDKQYKGKEMNTPKIGQHWPEQNGIYAGIARGFDSEPDGHIVLLDDMPPEEEMNWEDATAWAASLGNGAKLPTRFEIALIGANLYDKITPWGYLWTSSEHSASVAWCQFWLSSFPGGQYNVGKTNAGRVRAVRRLPI